MAALLAACGWWLANGLMAAEKSGSKNSAVSKVKERPDDVVDERETGAETNYDIDEDLTALIVPADVLGKVARSNRMEYSQALRGLLLEGVSIDGAAAARRHYETAHRAVAADPRAPYAFGLAFLEQKNSKEALAQFHAAAKQTAATYLPALQACAWVEIMRHEYGPALTALNDLARRIEEQRGPWPTERDRVHTAEWLGRTLGFLSGPGSDADHAVRFVETAAGIEKLLTGERRQAYQRGGAGITKRHKELEALAARPVAEVVSEMNAKRQDARTAVEAARDEIHRIETEIRDVKQPLDKQIAETNVEIRTSGQKAKNAAKDIPEAEELVDFLSVPQQKPNGVTRTYRGVPTGVRMRNENAQEKKARETQLASAKQRLQQLKTSVENARQSLVDARKQRDKAQADLRTAIAARQPELREARRKSQECAAHLREVEHAALSPEQIKSRVTALEAYVPLDPFIEKDRLMATLKAE
jgi:DNA repair exonuclease SbcCD ATPase subunit